MLLNDKKCDFICFSTLLDTEFTFRKAGEPGIHVFNVPNLEDRVLVEAALLVSNALTI